MNEIFFTIRLVVILKNGLECNLILRLLQDEHNSKKNYVLYKSNIIINSKIDNYVNQIEFLNYKNALAQFKRFLNDVNIRLEEIATNEKNSNLIKRLSYSIREDSENSYKSSFYKIIDCKNDMFSIHEQELKNEVDNNSCKETRRYYSKDTVESLMDFMSRYLIKINESKIYNNE